MSAGQTKKYKIPTTHFKKRKCLAGFLGQKWGIGKKMKKN